MPPAFHPPFELVSVEVRLKDYRSLAAVRPAVRHRDELGWRRPAVGDRSVAPLSRDRRMPALIFATRGFSEGMCVGKAANKQDAVHAVSFRCPTEPRTGPFPETIAWGRGLHGLY